MNYSPSEDYWKKSESFNKKSISTSGIKKRWFRNYYVLLQTEGFFKRETFTLKAGEFDPQKYSGEYYGPFLTKFFADQFAIDLKTHEDDFIFD